MIGVSIWTIYMIHFQGLITDGVTQYRWDGVTIATNLATGTGILQIGNEDPIPVMSLIHGVQLARSMGYELEDIPGMAEEIKRLNFQYESARADYAYSIKQDAYAKY